MLLVLDKNEDFELRKLNQNLAMNQNMDMSLRRDRRF
jgi:hypothetical protein